MSPTPRDVHLADQAAALDARVDAETREFLEAGGSLAPLSELDREFLSQLHGDAAATCDHAEGSLDPLFWTPRAPGDLVCRACAGAPEVEGACDSCRCTAAEVWREITLPRGQFEVGERVTPPVIVRLRLCQSCEGVDDAGV